MATKPLFDHKQLQKHVTRVGEHKDMANTDHMVKNAINITFSPSLSKAKQTVSSPSAQLSSALTVNGLVPV